MTLTSIPKIIEKSLQKRSHLRKITNALRLVNGKGDGLEGLTLDQYSQHFLIQQFHPKAKVYIETVASFIKTAFDPQFLIVKDRTSADGRSLDQPKFKILIDKSGSKTVVDENGLKFAVDLNDTVSTGLFLDMRTNRKMIGELSKGKRILNCFAYTCSFGVYCRAKGAVDVINVDISKKNLDKGSQNYQLNGIEASKKEFVKDNCHNYLMRIVKRGEIFDVVILDPPSFARYDNKVFNVERDLSELIALSLKVIDFKGVLFVSTNFSGLSNDNLSSKIRKICQLNGKNPSNITSFGQDSDFPGSGTMKESFLTAVCTQFA